MIEVSAGKEATQIERLKVYELNSTLPKEAPQFVSQALEGRETGGRFFVPSFGGERDRWDREANRSNAGRGTHPFGRRPRAQRRSQGGRRQRGIENVELRHLA